MRLLLALLISSSAIQAQEEKFAFTFSGAGCSKDPSDICLLQEQPLNAEVSLLDRDSNNVCYGKVTSHFNYEDQMLSFKASKVKKENCKSPVKNYFMAVLNKKVSSYSVLTPKVLNSDEAEKLGNSIFSSNKFEKYLSETETIKSYVKGKKIHYTVKDFPEVKFIARTYKDQNLNVSVVSQKLFQDSVTPPGALFALMGKDSFPVSDICIASDEKVLKIEDKHYFYTKSQGCDTDYVFDEIFRIYDNNVQLVLRDGSWSL